MSEVWLNYAVFIVELLLLFLIRAYYEKRLADAPRILLLGALSGIVPGLLCDLIFGKYLGIGFYTLGFGLPFLMLNAVLGYGLFAANILLLQRARFLNFCIWIGVITAVFEITNLYFPVWTYAFAVPSFEYWLIAFGGPLELAIVIAISWHVLLRYRFFFIDNLRKK